MTELKRNKRIKPDPELVKPADALLTNYQQHEGLIGENGLLKQLTKMLVERALETEITEHLGHDRSGAVTTAPTIPATAKVPRPCRAILVGCHWLFPATIKGIRAATDCQAPDPLDGF